jgi:hypothetical protein
LLTADGSDDDKVKPQHTVDYKFAAVDATQSAEDLALYQKLQKQPAREAAADGKDAKESEPPADDDEEDVAMESEPEEETELSESDSEEEVFFDSEDDDDSDSEAAPLAEALGATFVTVSKPTQLDRASLMFKKLVFRWKGLGWQRGTISRFYPKPTASFPFNVELTFEDGDRHDSTLNLEQCRCDANAPFGSWMLISKKPIA